MKNILFVLIGFVYMPACKKLVEVDPPRTDLIKSTVFTSDATAKAAMTEVYYQVGNIGFGSGNLNSITYLASLSSDEIINGVTYDVNLQEIYLNTISPGNSEISGVWEGMYSCIYKCNAIIEGISGTQKLSDSVRNNLEGEAKFWRAFTHFYLLNLFGEIPLITSTNYEQNSIAPRASRSDINEQIIQDLKDAQLLLKDDYSFSSGQKIGTNAIAATALLARVYLYSGDWEKAEIEATSIINNSNYTLLADVNSVFLKNSDEAILQFYPPSDGYAPDVITFLGYGSQLRPEFSLSFENGDKRKLNWIENGIYGPFDYPVKYKSIDGNFSEYSIVLRVAEQYLIRAEARIRQNKLTGTDSGESDINAIRLRAGLDPVMATSQPDLLLAVEQERNHELFTEWGHRWFDLKRYQHADGILSNIKDDWNSTDTLYPIPASQIINDPNIQQNQGY